MTAVTRTSYDGHIYEAGEELPDLGSFANKSSVKGVWEYYGLDADVSKLPTRAVYPKYKDLPSGSYAFCIDTGVVYMYSSSDDNWYEQ